MPSQEANQKDNATQLGGLFPADRKHYICTDHFCIRNIAE